METGKENSNLIPFVPANSGRVGFVDDLK